MKAVNDVQVTIRVDKNLKERAENLFSRIGLNMSTAVNVFLLKAVNEDGIPFPVSTKKAVYGASSTSDDITNAFQAAVLRENENKKANGLPVAKYDSELTKAYLEYPDGTREYVD